MSEPRPSTVDLGALLRDFASQRDLLQDLFDDFSEVRSFIDVQTLGLQSLASQTVELRSNIEKKSDNILHFMGVLRELKNRHVQRKFCKSGKFLSTMLMQASKDCEQQLQMCMKRVR